MHQLPKLDYGYADLEPFIDEATMRIHHTKHHQTYIDNLNNVIEGINSLKNLTSEEILKNTDKIQKKIRQTVINNAGGHANHSFFWKVMTPKPSEVSAELKAVLDSEFGSVEKFKAAFSEKAIGVFGSGWAFLVKDQKGALKLKRQSFQNSPLMSGYALVLGLDVWEHAYYLKYQNKRKDYIDAWWNIVNWDQVLKNYKS